jgi:hypothetical protein
MEQFADLFFFSIALLEIRLVLANLLFNFDIELQGKDFDFIRQSRSWMLWETPELSLKFNERCCEKPEGSENAIPRSI